jgi:transposase-like protein
MQSQPINHKNCPTCGSNLIYRNGHQSGVQRYLCRECKYRFQASKRPTQKAQILANQYLFKNNHYQI